MIEEYFVNDQLWVYNNSVRCTTKIACYQCVLNKTVIHKGCVLHDKEFQKSVKSILPEYPI